MLVAIDNIPTTLRARAQWGLWRRERDTKVPYAALRAGRASSANPETWCDFESAARTYNPRRDAGLAWFFAPDDGMTGVDLDKCRDPETGAISEAARAILDQLNSYSEVSPSGEGVKVWVRGKLPSSFKATDPAPGLKRIEVYCDRRFFAVTGQRLPEYPEEPQENQAGLEVLATTYAQHQAPADEELPQPDQRPRQQSGSTPGSRAPEWARRVLAKAIEMTTTAIDGEKHDELLAAARLAGGAIPHLSEQEIEHALYGAIAARAKDRRGALRTIRDGIAMGQASPLTPPETPPALLWQYGRPYCPACGAPVRPSKFFDGFYCSHHDPAMTWKGREAIPPTTATPATPAASAVKTPSADTEETENRALPLLISARDLHRLPPAEPLIPDVVYLNRLHQMFGAPGSGKSYLALDIACTVAQQLPVIYLAAEAIEDYQTRTVAWADRHGTEIDRLFFWREPLQLADRAAVQQFAALAAEIRPALVIVDPLADCMAGLVESSQDGMAVAVAALNEIRRATGAGILIVHHTGWNDERERGSSILRGASRVVAKVEQRDDGLIVFSCVKKNQGAKFATRYFRLTPSAEDVVPLPASRVLITRATVSDKMLRVMEALTTEPLREGATHTALQQDSQFPPATLNRVLTSLSEAGYVSAFERGRSRLYALTDAGHEALEAAHEAAGNPWKNDPDSGGVLPPGSFNWYVCSSASNVGSSAVLSSSSAPLPPSRVPSSVLPLSLIESGRTEEPPEDLRMEPAEGYHEIPGYD